MTESLTDQSLGAFLRSRRAKVLPGDIGLYQGRRRRVQGLRREELSGLAGLSTDYYARLEQGRHSHPSPAVLNAIADVLLLSQAERDYLHLLANSAGKPASQPKVREETTRVMSALGTTPVVLVGSRMEILASNGAARRLYGDFDVMPADRRNAIRWMLTAPTTRKLYGDDWESVASDMIGMLRVRFGRQPQDTATRHLITQLCSESEFFRTVWSDQTVSGSYRPVKRFQHPEAGTIDTSVQLLHVHGSDDQALLVLVPTPGSADDRAWRDLMGRTADCAVTAITDIAGRR